MACISLCLQYECRKWISSQTNSYSDSKFMTKELGFNKSKKKKKNCTNKHPHAEFIFTVFDLNRFSPIHSTHRSYTEGSQGRL